MSEQAHVNRQVQPAPLRIAQSTLIVMVAFGVAKVISLAQTFIIARVFGVGREWDAYVTANSIPELIFTLVAGGALANAFIPVFTAHLAQENRQGAWRTASHVINVVFVVTLMASTIAFIVAPALVANVVAPGFTGSQQAETVALMRILLVSTLIFSVSGILMGILQSFNRFLLPALAPILFDLGILFGVVFLSRPFGVYGIAYGAVIGAALHLGIQVPGLFSVRARWSPRLGLNDPELWRIIRLMIPLVAGLFLFSYSFIVMNNIASRLGEGAVSALSWGWRLMQIPETLIGTAMGVVILPTLSALSASRDLNGKRDAMSGALRFILITTIPAAVGMIVIGRPLISVLEGGAFDSAATTLVYNTLVFFMLGMVTQSLVEVAARAFYADKDTLIPLIASAANAALNIGLAFTFSGIAAVEARGFTNLAAATFPTLGISAYAGNVGGLALAQSIGFTVEIIVLMLILRRRWQGVNERALFTTLVKAGAASAVMAVAVLGLHTVFAAFGLFERGRILLIVVIGIEVIVGGIVFMAAAWVLRTEELRTLWALLRRRSVRVNEPAVAV
ncbi:MAG: murein biosynthesis integral membrane protein MurJ [bacterium]|nr:murein biosynthesis integral membrane protein MurJ [bacterium]